MDMASRLELFLEIAEQGSFAKVADQRNIDRSVVSKQIKALEEELSLRLLNRSTRSLSLTDAGLRIIKQAELMRNVLVDTRRIADAYQQEPKGLLRVTSNTSLGQSYIRDAIVMFMDRYPKIQIDLIVDDRRLDLITQKVDVAFRTGPIRDSNMVATKLAANTLVLVASPAFINKFGNPKTIAELAPLPAVTYANDMFHLDKLEIGSGPQSDKLIKIDMQSRLKANDIGTLIKAVQAGIGYSIFSLSNLTGPIQSLGLVPLLQDHKIPDIHGSIYALYPHRNIAHHTRMFIETVRECIGEPPVWDKYVK